MSNQQPPTTNHRSLTGFVTKLVGDGATYGFINDEIFFPQTNVTGGPASVGDQVFAECEFSAHLPIKWNATSVKILNKAGTQHTPNNPPVPERSQQPPQQQQHQQDMMNPQHLQQFNNQQQNVALTYQQHRQQRQQRQMLDMKQQQSQQQPNNSLSKQTLNQGGEPPARMLDQGINQGEYFSPNQRSFPQQQQQQQQSQQADSSMQPFQDQPMGPPNFAYTSQLGSAFVQNQFVPAPFMPQQPPPMLPQQQQQQQQPQQEHLLPQNNQMHNQNNQRHNQQHNKGMSGGRFNDNKNDRQNRRNQNRNDDKYDGPRDRDGSRNRLSKSNGSRERSIGHGSKRDDVPTRVSPPPHSSARSTTSIGSDRGSKSRKHYEIINIPKITIMTNMNAYNMKQRCPSSVHVPSDLKDIIVNRYFRLDIKNMPKPIKFNIESVKGDVTTSEEHSKEIKEVETSVVVAKPEEEDSKTQDTKPSNEPICDGSEGDHQSKREEKPEIKSAEQSTPSSKSDFKLNHKYGVKVILISMPDLETIFRKVFGDNYDSFTSDNKSHVKLDEVVTLLCNKGSNNGYSLVGGKFDPSLDGFVEGEQNEFERHKKQPDLIATCKRVVQGQTGLDLSECRSWTLLATFLYNNKSDYFSSKASVEYSFIYIPQLWTMLKDHFDKNILNKESIDLPEPANTQDSESSVAPKIEIEETESILQQNASTVEQEEPNDPISSSQDDVTPTISVDNLSELKVTDLKTELDKRNVKYKGGAKKAELVALLLECLKPPEKDMNESQEVSQVEGEELVESEEATDTQLEEGEVAEADAEASEESPIPDAAPSDSESSKRKEREAGEEEGTSNKKVCSGQQPVVKEKKVELFTESFKVFSRDGQQQLSLVSLNEATQAGRYDQFELSVSSNILKESLIQHLSEYILTVLVEDNRQKSSGGNLGTTSSLSSQETTSDTNNNNAKSSFKNPASSSEQKINLKELPVDRYINLAFTYFDSTHMGFVYFEDLNKLFNNTGMTISKRALISLVGESEKINYRTIPDLSAKLPPTYIYEFPGQFTRPQIAPSFSNFGSDQPNYKSKVRMIEYKGVSYDIEKLIQQVKDAETLRVSLADRFNYAIENSDKQAEEIHVLEVSQKSLAKAIKAQNDEICDLKRERDSIKKKVSDRLISCIFCCQWREVLTYSICLF